MGKYTTEQKDREFNPDFWREVLVGRTIAEIVHDEHGMRGFKLDNGEEISLVPLDEPRATLSVNVE